MKKSKKLTIFKKSNWNKSKRLKVADIRFFKKEFFVAIFQLIL